MYLVFNGIGSAGYLYVSDFFQVKLGLTDKQAGDILLLLLPLSLHLSQVLDTIVVLIYR